MLTALAHGEGTPARRTRWMRARSTPQALNAAINDLRKGRTADSAGRGQL
jgi:ATP-dependent Clp protease ATP-binding subunit ClpB